MSTQIGQRAVRLHTEHGTASGMLRVAERLRTLDDLNISGRNFINLHDVSFEPPSWRFGPGAVSINRDNVYFVIEVGETPRRRGEQLGYTRAGARSSSGPTRSTASSTCRPAARR